MEETPQANEMSMILDAASQIADHTSSKTPAWWLIVTLIVGFGLLLVTIKWMAAKLSEQRDEHTKRLETIAEAHKAELDARDKKLEILTERFIDNLEKGNLRMEQVVQQNTQMHEQLLKGFQNHERRLDDQFLVIGKISEYLKS